MKTLLKKKSKMAVVAQCCAEVSALVAGCHD